LLLYCLNFQKALVVNGFFFHFGQTFGNTLIIFQTSSTVKNVNVVVNSFHKMSTLYTGITKVYLNQFNLWLFSQLLVNCVSAIWFGIISPNIRSNFALYTNRIFRIIRANTKTLSLPGDTTLN
jgi:hypothetical protein